MREVALYRQPVRGLLDSWRRYQIFVDGLQVNRISIGQLKAISVASDAKTIQLRCGDLVSEQIRVAEVPSNRTLFCVRTANPKLESPHIRISFIDDDELRQRLFRFDQPPYSYFGGRVGGLIIGISMTLAVTLSVPILIVLAIFKAISQPSAETISFLIIAGGLLALMLTAVASIGLRTLYFYFKLPATYRN